MSGPDAGALRPEAEALLAAPAGRAVLAELVGLDLLADLGELAPGSARLVASGPARAGHRRAQHGHGRPGQEAKDVIAAAVRAADLDRLSGCRDQLLLLSAVAKVVDGQQAAAEPYLAAARGALVPVAEALAAAPAARWWWEPVNRGAQRWVGAQGAEPPRGAALAAAVQRATAGEQAEQTREEAASPWRRFWPGRRRRPASVAWWSPPLGGTVFTTTGPIGELPAVGLGCVADSAGDELVEVWAIEIGPGARIREIGGPADWAELVAEFPRDVTASRGYDWDQWTGQEGVTWALPDWPAMSREWDGVHVSVGGYLAASDVAVAAGSASTLLAGWEPDQTLWLTDVFTKAEHLPSWRGSPGSEAMPDTVPPWLGHRAAAGDESSH